MLAFLALSFSSVGCCGFSFEAVEFVFFVIPCFISKTVARQDIKSKLCVILWFDSGLHRLCDIPPPVPHHTMSISDWIPKDASWFWADQIQKGKSEVVRSWLRSINGTFSSNATSLYGVLSKWQLLFLQHSLMGHKPTWRLPVWVLDLLDGCP